MKNQPHKLVNSVTLVVDVVKELPHLTVPAVMKVLIFMKEFVDLAQQDTMETVTIGHVNNVMDHAVLAQDQKTHNVPIVAMKHPDSIYKMTDNVYTHVHPTIMPTQPEHVNHVTQHVKHAMEAYMITVLPVIPPPPNTIYTKKHVLQHAQLDIMKMMKHGHVNHVFPHAKLVKQLPTVTLVLKTGIYMELLVSLNVMKNLDYGMIKMIGNVPIVTNHVKLVMNHMRIPMNVLHVH